MPIHSRPHLTTHNRAQGHSAVAAAAYRLGVRLRDRRTGTWHDYSRRKAGEEVVTSLTVAPSDSPAWVDDPDELWNRAEASEKRKDAQVARDYVVPIPMGLTDEKAKVLATLLARYICDQHHTPVTVAVHRDADTDMFGNPKPANEQGFHAHLLFPTRRLLSTNEMGTDDAGQCGFGEKLSALSNRRTSSGLVELMNAHWAELSNDLAAEAGLVADYDHRSYERLGIDRVPRPRLSQKEVALVKKGVFPPKFDALRDIMVASKPGAPLPGDVLFAQWERARVDVEQARLAETSGDSLRTDSSSPTGESVVAVTTTRPGSDEHPVDTMSWGPVLVAARARGRLDHAAIADRFVAAFPEPKTDKEGVALLRLSSLVWAIQRVLRKLEAVAEKLKGCREDIRRWDLAAWRSDLAMDEARKRKRKLDAAAENHVRTHRWTAWVSKAQGKQNRVLGVFQEEAKREQRIYDEHLTTRDSANQSKFDARAEEAVLVAEEQRVRVRLAEEMEAFVEIDAKAVPLLVGLVSVTQREWLSPWVPPQEEPTLEPVAPTAPASVAPVDLGQQATLPERPRLRRRP